MSKESPTPEEVDAILQHQYGAYDVNLPDWYTTPADYRPQVIPGAAVEAARCAHSFVRRPGWWRHRKSWMRWECHCGLTTRTYDAVDRMGTRPIHPRMPVAVPGYNTKGRR